MIGLKQESWDMNDCKNWTHRAPMRCASWENNKESRRWSRETVHVFPMQVYKGGWLENPPKQTNN